MYAYIYDRHNVRFNDDTLFCFLFIIILINISEFVNEVSSQSCQQDTYPDSMSESYIKYVVKNYLNLLLGRVYRDILKLKGKLNHLKI